MWGDGIENANPKNKSADYTVVECDTDADLVLPYSHTQKLHKGARTAGRWGKKNCQVGGRSEYREPSTSYYPLSTQVHHRGIVV